MKKENVFLGIATVEGILIYEIEGPILVHHMNPIAVDDIINCTPYLMNPEFLICTSFNTHQDLHYKNLEMLKKVAPSYLIERKPNDTCPWKSWQLQNDLLLWS